MVECGVDTVPLMGVQGMDGVERGDGVVEVGRASSVGMATVVTLGVAKGDWWEILKPVGAWGEVVTGWSEDWPLSEEVDSPDDSTPSSTSSSTGEGWEGREVGT